MHFLFVMSQIVKVKVKLLFIHSRVIYLKLLLNYSDIEREQFIKGEVNLI